MIDNLNKQIYYNVKEIYNNRIIIIPMITTRKTVHKLINIVLKLIDYAVKNI